jgi:Arc/MetJ-type ribon-helix-helix transcriptional regulator
MCEDTMDLAADHAVEAILRDELARENRALSGVVAVLRHLLVSDAQALVSDAILARVRGMMVDCAAQLLTAMEGRDPVTGSFAMADPAVLDNWAEELTGEEPLLAFCHALANEGLLTERFQQRHAIDPVLSPLIQELIASDDPAIAALAMSALAAQSRFIQSQRRMELPLGELPAELFHMVIALGDRRAADEVARAGLARLQRSYDEATSRLGLLARLVATMRRGAVAALALDHAGLALFVSGLAAQTRQPREAAVLACHEGQGARLALMLRSAGLSLPLIERQLLLVEPAARMPRAIASLSAERAAALLGADRTA